MSDGRTYPEGVTSWIDIEHQDVEAAQAYYGGLFGWTFTDAAPPGARGRYLIAQLDGRDAAGIAESAEPTNQESAPSVWNTYVAVADADAAAARITAAGGRVWSDRPMSERQAGPRFLLIYMPPSLRYRRGSTPRYLGGPSMTSGSR
jgi:predicted enzyme related to lactoylglutathione lyase